MRVLRQSACQAPKNRQCLFSNPPPYKPPLQRDTHFVEGVEEPPTAPTEGHSLCRVYCRRPNYPYTLYKVSVPLYPLQSECPFVRARGRKLGGRRAELQSECPFVEGGGLAVWKRTGVWRGWRGSNPRPLASEANTLSTELQPRGPEDGRGARIPGFGRAVHADAVGLR